MISDKNQPYTTIAWPSNSEQCVAAYKTASGYEKINAPVRSGCFVGRAIFIIRKKSQSSTAYNEFGSAQMRFSDLDTTPTTVPHMIEKRAIASKQTPIPFFLRRSQTPTTEKDLMFFNHLNKRYVIERIVE